MTLGPPLAPNAALVIGRARVAGAVRRAQLKRALAAGPLDGLGLAPDEILLVPRLSVTERLAPDGPSSPFTRSFASALRTRLEQAARDPAGAVAPGQAVRFSSRARMAAWLIGQSSLAATYATGLCADMPGVTDFDGWVHKVLLTNAPSTAHCASLLYQRGQLAGWLARLDGNAFGTIEQGLWQAYCVTFPAIPLVNEPRPEASFAAAPVFAGVGDTDILQLALGRHLSEQALGPRPRAIAAALIWSARYPGRAASAEGAGFIASVAATSWPRPETLRAGGRYSRPVQPPGLSAQDADGPSLAEAPGLLPATEARQTAIVSGYPLAPAMKDYPGPADQPPSPLPATAAVSPGIACGETSAIADEHTFTSAFCGLFYLIAPLRQLGFVTDFALDRGDSTGLPPFALLDRLGVHWFGRAYLASLLHRWAVQQAAPLRLPGRFVHPCLHGGGSLPRKTEILRDGRHCCLWHKEGYPLIDRPGWLDRRAMLALAPAGSFADGRVRRADVARRLPAVLGQRWIAALARTLEIELDQRRGNEPLSPDHLRLSGRVRIADAAMTVEFALDDLPFAVRYAGLDRNPGWLQQEGRSLAFVYR